MQSLGKDCPKWLPSCPGSPVPKLLAGFRKHLLPIWPGRLNSKAFLQDEKKVLYADSASPKMSGSHRRQLAERSRAYVHVWLNQMAFPGRLPMIAEYFSSFAIFDRIHVLSGLHLVRTTLAVSLHDLKILGYGDPRFHRPF